MAPRDLTPAQRHVARVKDELMASALADKPHYPNALSIIPTDIGGLADSIAFSAARGYPILLVYPDGRECLLRPQNEIDEATAKAEFEALIAGTPKPVGGER